MTRATVTPSTWEWLADVTERLADLLDGCDLSDLPEQVRERLALGRAHMYATAAVMDAAAEHLDKTPALLGVQAVDEVRGTGTGLESILRGEGAQ